MVDASLAAKKSSSFDLVEKELFNTVEQAELSLDRFQENRESGEDLQNCIDYLNQLRGIFTLIELQGGQLLCQESVAIANEVPIGASEDKNSLLASLSQALFIMRRYIEYYDRRREDHPELLLDIVNLLREARNAKPLPESYFFDVEFERIAPRAVSNDAVTAEVFELRARRMRHMYQVGLLSLLRDDNREVGFRLMQRAGEGFHRICAGSSIADLWLLVSNANRVMLSEQMLLTKSRKQLLMRIEKYARELVKLGKLATSKQPTETVARNLLYIIAVSGDHSVETREVLAGYQLQPEEFNEIKLSSHRSLLMGPGGDVLASLSKALHEELGQIKDKLDIIERGIDSDEQSAQQIADSLGTLADTLVMLDLRKLSEMTRTLQAKVMVWARDKRQPTNNELVGIADSVLNIEQAITQLEDEGLTSETDKIATQQTTSETSPYLQEARIVVVSESQSGIALAKRAITAYLESRGDKLHLSNVIATLTAIGGALFMLEQKVGADVVKRTADSIQALLIDQEDDPAEHILETLADALTSLEYYVDSMSRVKAGSQELLELADASLKSLGY